MTQGQFPNFRSFSLLCGILILLLFVDAAASALAQPQPAAVLSFNAYIAALESRLARQHGAQSGFIATLDSGSQIAMRLRSGESIVEKLTPSSGAEFPGAMLHHWRGTAFVAGAKATDFERLMRDFSAYPQIYSPQVMQARVLAQQNDRLQASMRVRQHHVITVVMDTTYDITFARLDAQHGYSISRSTRISEIGSPGTGQEHVLDSGHEHGFLWRLNTYWSYEERNGGLYMQIESVSLTRSIPLGLGWAVGPFVESVPRESLEFTLSSTRRALQK